jgi:hypothetical protein
MKLSWLSIENIQEYIVGDTYVFLYWKDGELLEVRGKVTKLTWSHVTITVLLEE